MGRKLQAFSRYRPRLLTLLVVPPTAALVVLSNLIFADGRLGHDIPCLNYGWPLVWWRMIVIPPLTVGYQFHRLRLAIDVAVWLLILIAVGGACEWLARRYRLRLRWSLRTMLVITALAAACCGWFAIASRRARQQEEVVALVQAGGGFGGGVWIERWGSRWLGFLGLERYFQQIAGAMVVSEWRPDAPAERILNRLKDVPSLRLLYLLFSGDTLSPSLVESLNAMPQLRILEVSEDTSVADRSAEQAIALGDACLASIGRMNQLEQLCLESPSGKALEKLADLHRLRALHLEFESAEYDDDYDPYSSPPLIARLPIFPQLETLTFDGPYLVDNDLRRIAAQPRLKALRIFAPLIFADLAALGALDSLEELTIVAPLCRADILALRGLNHLKTLHINDMYGDGLPDSVDEGFDTDKPPSPAEFDRQALLTLRRSRPGIVVDGHTNVLFWNRYHAVPPEYARLSSGQPSSGQQSISVPWLHAWFWTHGDLMIRDMDLPW